MVGARSDRDAFAGTPVDRLGQAQDVVPWHGAVAQRHPRRARFAVQIDRPAIERCQKLAAQQWMDRCAPIRGTRTQRDVQSLFERVLGAACNQCTGAFHQNPLGADRNVLPSDDRGAFDMQRTNINVLIDDQGATDIDSDGLTPDWQLSAPGMRI